MSNRFLLIYTLAWIMILVGNLKADEVSGGVVIIGPPLIMVLPVIGAAGVYCSVNKECLNLLINTPEEFESYKAEVARQNEDCCQ
jgi:hypothetical protein